MISFSQVDARDLKDVLNAHYNCMESMITHKLSTYKYNKFIRWLDVNNVSLKKLIIGDFEQLKKIKDQIGASVPFYSFKNDFESLYDSFSKRKNTTYDSIHLVSAIGVRVCPYCNRNYVYNALSRSRTCELDHFFDKSTYPYFALSFYNLIPCCGNCNRFKSRRSLDLSPYDQTVEWDDHYEFSYLPQTGEIKREDDFLLELKTKSQTFKANNNDIFRLKELYSLHKPEVLDLLLRNQTYCPSQMVELEERFPRFLANHALAIRTIFGQTVLKKNVMKVPLCKLLSSIYEKIRN